MKRFPVGHWLDQNLFGGITVEKFLLYGIFQIKVSQLLKGFLFYIVLLRSFSQNDLCIDTVDGTVGSKPGLWKCHDSGGNQVMIITVCENMAIHGHTCSKLTIETLEQSVKYVQN